MNSPDSEHTSHPEPHENEPYSFLDKFRELLPGIEFEEPVEMLEARMAVLEALAGNDQETELLRSVWGEYAQICEQAVDSRIEVSPQIRAQLQLAALVQNVAPFLSTAQQVLSWHRHTNV
jgi:hypothetical protein